MATIADALNAVIRLRREGNLAGAERRCREILEAEASNAHAWHQLGLLEQARGDNGAAKQCYQRAVDLCPDLAEAHLDLGAILQAEDRTAAAEQCYRNAIRGKSDYAPAHNNLGTIFKLRKDFGAAAECYQRAVELQEDFAEAHHNLAKTCFAMGRAEVAEASFRRALKLAPDNAEIHNGLGVLLQARGRLSEALACFEAALARRSDYADAHRNRSELRLLTGNFAEGWPEFEWRRQASSVPPPGLPYPRWEGQSFAGRTLLLIAERGTGDVIQFVRYAPLVQQRGKRVILRAPNILHALLASAPGIDRIVDQKLDGESPKFCAPLMSLPMILGTELTTIPATVPYLSADGQRVAIWRRKLSKIPKFKVGIAWQGNPIFALDAYRSIPLESFVPLADCPNVQLFSLQKRFGQDQLPPLAERLKIKDLGHEIDTDYSKAFVDTAAVMMNLDLVITSDTAIAHLAGARREGVGRAAASARVALAAGPRRQPLVSDDAVIPPDAVRRLDRRVCAHRRRIELQSLSSRRPVE